MNKFTLTVFITSTFVVFLIATAVPVQAQESTGLSISPLTFELTANPGDVLANKLKIRNPSQSVLQVIIEVEDFAVSGEEGQVIIEPADTESYSLASWITPIPRSFTLEPGAQETIDFIVEVPADAEPGGHYGSILATIGGSSGDGEFQGAAVAQKVGSLVLMTVAGDVKEDIRIKEFLVSEFFETGPIPFTIRFENKGTVHVKPLGFITITNWRDKKVVDLEFSAKNVLPNSVRKVDATWDKKWLFGKYTATIVGSYGNSNVPITPVVRSFWVVPWKILSIAGTVIFVVFLFFFLTRKRWTTAAKILLRGDRSR